jgi:O-antigen/teichoic acid export membrane protein
MLRASVQSLESKLELGIARRVAGSAIALVGRRVALTAITSLTTAIVARKIGISEFGSLASALGAYYLALAVVDLGFGLVLSRDFARRPEARSQLLSTAFRVQGAWATLIAFALVALGLLAGAHTTRGGVLLALAPGILAAGLGAGRQVFIAAFSTRKLAALDLATNAVASTGAITLALSGAGAVGVAGAMSAGAVVNSVLVAAAARRIVPAGRPMAGDARRLVGLAIPLGIASLLSSVYFSIDLVILGWLVTASALGAYGVATKLLTLLVMLPALTLNAALPGFATVEGDRQALALLMARVWHWLASFGLPLCTGTFVFAGPIVSLAFGDGYDAAVPLVRVLAVAGAVALFANVLGTVLVALSAIRPLIAQNTAALILNVAGNVALVPRFGVIASAWLTVATEVFVAGGSLLLVRARLGSLTGLRNLLRPLIANGSFATVGLLLLSRPALAIPAAIVTLIAATHLLHAWPQTLARVPSSTPGI